MVVRLVFAGVLAAAILLGSYAFGVAIGAFDHPSKEQAVVVAAPKPGVRSVMLDIALPEPHDFEGPPRCHWGCPGDYPIAGRTGTYLDGCDNGGADIRLKLRIAPMGQVASARVIETSDQCFSASVRLTVMSWRYRPDVHGRWRTVETGLRYAAQDA